MLLAAVKTHEKERRQHLRDHTAQAPAIREAKLSSCAGLQELHICPLLSRRWTMREVPGGLELSAHVPKNEVVPLRESIRCHQAIGKRFDRRADICVLQNPAVSTTSPVEDGGLILVITTNDPAWVAPLRRRLRGIVTDPR